ncbi:hypothetical protein [Candidatus Nephthysia bennettiae]
MMLVKNRGEALTVTMPGGHGGNCRHDPRLAAINGDVHLVHQARLPACPSGDERGVGVGAAADFLADQALAPFPLRSRSSLVGL